MKTRPLTLAALLLATAATWTGCARPKGPPTPVSPTPRVELSGSRADRDVDASDGAGTPRWEAVEGELRRVTGKRLEVVTGGQSLVLMRDEHTRAQAAVREGTQVRASFQIQGEQRLARNVEVLEPGGAP